MWLQHHGIKGQKWGVRRYQNPDGSLTEAGRNRYLAINRIRKNSQTNDDVNKIVNSWDETNRKRFDIPDDEDYMTLQKSEHVVKRILVKDGDKPVAFIDFASGKRDPKTGKEYLNVAVGVDQNEQGKGYGKQVAKEGYDWLQKNSWRYSDVTWNALNENVGSQKLAESAGFKQKSSNKKWKSYRYSK